MLACMERSSVLPFQQNYHSSEDEVTFGNLKQYYRHNETIVVEYTLGQKVRASSHDFVGMYPLGWQTIEQFVAFEFAIVRPAEAYRRQRKVVFQPRHRVDHIQPGIEYIFMYISKETMHILGTSRTFLFIPDSLPDHQPDIWQSCDEKLLKTGRPLRKAHDGHSLPFQMDNLSVTQQYSSCVMSPPWIRPTQQCHSMFDLQGGPSSVVPLCIQCKCPANYALTQQEMLAKVRAVSEELHEEQARAAALEKQLELSRAAQAKLRLSAQYAVREKNVALAYLNGLIGSLSERGILKMANSQSTSGQDHRQRYCQSPPVASKIHHRHDASTSNTVPQPPPGLLTARERLLKAIIGSQEATIRELVRKLGEANSLKCSKEPEVQKPKTRVEKVPEISKNKSAKVDTVQSVMINAEQAQFGNREVLPDSDDSDCSESRSSFNNGVENSK